MRVALVLVLILIGSRGQAQLQEWQRERTVEHLGRIKNYHGHVTANIAGEKSEAEVWFEAPNRFLIISKSGEIARSDGQTMDLYDPETKFHLTFRHMPSVSESDRMTSIRELFDKNMSSFTFTLGRLGKVANRAVIELSTKPKPKVKTVIEKSESQIFDEFAFPLKSTVTYKGGRTTTYEFKDIAINEKFELPAAKIPSSLFNIEWDFNEPAPLSSESVKQFQNLKLEKVVKHQIGGTLSFYRNGGLYASVIRYNNFGMTPPDSGIPVKVGNRNGYYVPSLFSNTITVTDGAQTSIYASNLLIDDLIEFAAK